MITENINESTLKIYSKFELEFENLRSFAMKKEDLEFNALARCAYVKCYDFIIHCCSSNDIESSFFKLPVLRGLCEDLITLSYLQNKPLLDIKNFIKELTTSELYNSILVQEEFFKKYNPGQIIVPSNVIPSNEKHKILNKPKNKNKADKLGYATLPTIFQMAKECGLEDLYNYIYYATSKSVHFSPDTLLKLAWGDLNKNTGVITAKISYKNYYKYYNNFVVFYSSYIFIKQTHAFKTILNISDDIFNSTDQLLSEYKKDDWPELTTFDHSNIKGPGSIFRILNRAGYENQ